MTARIKTLFNTQILIRLTLLAGAVILAVGPVSWLITSWNVRSYNSQGGYVFALSLLIFFWSLTSPLKPQSVDRKQLAIWLLIGSAIVRLIGQLIAVNVIGAVALVVDVYAIGLLARLGERKRALSPGWLAVIFAFSLPLERIVQRLIGFGLQNISADGACLALEQVFDTVTCLGIRIIVEGKDVLVDLPCSGARAVLLLLLFFSLCAGLARPRPHQALAGLALAMTAAILANILRITILAAGIARPEFLWNIDVLAQPWHDLIGLLTLAISCAPLIIWATNIQPRDPAKAELLGQPKLQIPDRIMHDGWWLAPPKQPQSNLRALLSALGFIVISLVVVSLPRTPIDVARQIQPLQLPVWLNGTTARPIALSPNERTYFVNYGGAAAKARYGDQVLLVIRTSAPLRHLHAPDECLRGLGFSVDYLGTQFTPFPTAVYRAVDSEGSAFRINVSFKSDQGQVTANVSQAIWYWLQNSKTNWTAIQRITPWNQAKDKRQNMERAVASYFGLSGALPARAQKLAKVEPGVTPRW